MNKKHVQQLFTEFARLNPNPKGELESVNEFTFLVAVVLSAQATDVGVNKATRALFKVVQHPSDVIKLGIEGLTPYIQTIGLYRSKARYIMALSQQLIQYHGGEVPRTRSELETLPGVGRKTANVVLNTLFDESTIAVDTHVFRVARRIGLSPGGTPLEVENDLTQVVPKIFQKHAHHWLILHGRYICKAKKPLCQTCPVSHLCEFYRSGQIS